MADTPRTIDYSTLRLAVEYADGTRVEGIRVIPSATRAIEAEFNEQFSKVATFDREDWMHTAAWTFLKLREGEDRPFDEWLATVDRLQIGVADDDRPTSGPTRKSSGSSGRRSTKAKTSTD